MAIESKMSRGPIGRPPPQSGRKALGSWAWIAGLLVIAAIGGAWYYLDRNPSAPSESSVSAPIESGDYQAVFLDNGQVYFGKLDRSDKDLYRLTDVFYLQSGVQVEPTANLSLTKLGSEAHGPQDQMLINPAHVLFIEDMKADSKVAQAIEQYKASKK